jgi:hypothetical protein
VSSDAITLSIPQERPFHGVARLVVGGLAARLDLSYEALEDLQLALASVLERDGYSAGREVTVKLEVGSSSVAMVIGPLDEDEVKADLADEGEDGISLRRLLTSLVEEVELAAGEGGAWLRLEKHVAVKDLRERG